MSLVEDQVEEILEKLPIKSLLRFRLVSRKWRMIIDSQYFKERHMKYQRLQKPDLLLMVDREDDDDLLANQEVMLRQLVYGNHQHRDLLVEQEAVSLQIQFDDISKSVDGLICIYDFQISMFVVNPSTQWLRQVPQAMIQAFVNERYADTDDDDDNVDDDDYAPNLLGFGKDKFIGTYKLVWLYNVLESDIKDATTCEVFDFNTNLWRQVESPPYRIFVNQSPIDFNGSLHWLVYEANNAIKILSFDCHTEVFLMISESPITEENQTRVTICNMNNRLCVSEKKWPKQEIWALDTSNMTWEKIYSLDLSSSPNGLLGDETGPIASPIAVLKNKKVLLFNKNVNNPKLVIYDLETKSYSLCSEVEDAISVAPYCQSLISIN